MTRFFVIAALILAACSGSDQLSQQLESPTLVSLTRLPPLPFDPYLGRLRLVFLLGIRPDGTIANARLLTPTRFSEWNDGAVDSVRKWRYAPVDTNSAPPIRWIRNTVTMRIEEPVCLDLGVLSAPTAAASETLYARLVAGANFDSIARSNEPIRDGPDWFSRAVDVSELPQHIRDAVKDLEVAEFTRPLPLGRSFVIYKRYDANFIPQLVP